MKNKSSSAESIVLFDGVCNLCNGFVQFIIKRDPSGQFKFAALQSETGQMLTQKYLPNQHHLSTVVLIEGDKAYIKSDAALRIGRKLGGFSLPARAASIVPRGIRNAVYDWVGRNRYRWFGKEDQCWIPTPALSKRFL